MEIRARHDGAALPFERDRRLVLRRLPVGAVVTRAVFTLTPVSTDPARRFLETITLPAGTGPGTWGAGKVVTTGAVEIDLHARRRLASLAGSGVGLATAPLLVDVGGGFMAVDEDGGFSDGSPYLVGGGDLPGLTVTGLRLPAANADVSVLRVSSPPSNLTLAVEGGPVFFSHVGDLVEPVTTPDVGELLQALLPGLDVEHGSVVVPFVLHSTTIARLDVTLDLELAVTLPATPDGVRAVTADYRYDGAPVAGHLAVAVPPGMVAVPGGTTGRVQGAFAATRIVHGPLTDAAADALVTAEAGRGLAQSLVTATTEVVTSVDLQLTAVTAEARLAVDLVEDLDGKPGRTSFLTRPAELTLTRDAAGSPTWLNVTLPGEVEVPAGRRTWLVVQTLAGTAAWSAAAAAADTPVLQHTRDGGLSWRAAAAEGTVPGAGLGGALRLRHTTTGFRMPLELRVAGGGEEVAVPLQRFAPSGQVDFDLDFPEVAAAVNAAVRAAGAGAPPGEQVANGHFADWFRVGTTPRRGRDVRTEPDGATRELTVFAPDGARAFVAGRRFVQDRARVGVVEVDVFAGAALRETVLADGEPLALVRDGAGRRLAVVVAGADGQGSDGLLLVDPTTLRAVGGTVELPPGTVTAAADGRGVYLAHLRQDESGPGTVLRQVDWADLEAAAGGSAVDWDGVPRDDLPGAPAHLSTGPDGRLAVLTVAFGPASVIVRRLFSYRDLAAVRSGDAHEAGPAAVDEARATAWAGADLLLVAARDSVRYVRTRDLAVVDEVPLEPGSATSVAVDATGTLAVVAVDDEVAVLDVATRRVITVDAVVPGEGDAVVAVSPPGAHALLTRPHAERAHLVPIGDALPAEWELTAGTVRPVSLPTTGEVMAMLGRVPVEVRSVADAARPVLAREPAGPSAVSQVVPAVGGARYRFAFDGVALVEGAVAEVRWSGEGCAPERVDRVPVTVADVGATLDTVPHHETVVVAPAGARSAEVRFVATESVLLVDRVTLSGSASVTGSQWSPGAGTVATPQPPDAAGRAGVVLSNGGAVEAAVTQQAVVPPGVAWQLAVTATASGTPGARLEVVFVDDAGVGVGEAVTVPLDPLDLDARAASGTVPAEASEAVLVVVLPAGAEVRVDELRLTAADPTAVDLYFASEAPGELSMTDVAVTVDAEEPLPTPVPPEGLCPPAPPPTEDGEACYCQACGSTGPVSRTRAARTDAGRPAVVTPCQTCGTDRVHTGGQLRRTAGGVPLPRFRTVDRPAVVRTGDERLPTWVGGPALTSELRVEADVTEVEFVGPSRAAALAAAGVHDVVALSRADRDLVAELPGVSDALAARIIASAAELVRRRGRRVPMGL
ncbi:helix-hairpin-helix domain-containing protein [Georgenia sp. H159]|uniref:helix-hairpin-helix domain-containing protein n=1 Tax=Georgenia sp. H159 TaxID=3076115 RepID=UPI002D799B20|nr:helix-hairpin-helix domain-containing protein [Georgenia sp. H159]